MGLENEEDEKSRRWTQCMQFLRNNPKLLMQMIPNPSDDEDDLASAKKSAVLVGKPRPNRRNKTSRPPKPVQKAKSMLSSAKQDISYGASAAAGGAINQGRFLAVSSNNAYDK